MKTFTEYDEINEEVKLTTLQMNTLRAFKELSTKKNGGVVSFMTAKSYNAKAIQKLVELGYITTDRYKDAYRLTEKGEEVLK